MDHRERAQRTLYRLTHLLAMGTQGSSLLRTILREALGLTGARGGQVLLLSADRRRLLTHVGEGDGNADGEAIAADAPPWAEAIREGKVVCLRATPTAAHPLSADRPITLGIPLLARGDVLGVLALRDLSAEWAKPERAPLVEILVDETNHMLWMRATHGGSQTWMQYPPLDLATSFLGEVVRSGSPLAVLDLQDKIHHRCAPWAAQEGLSSLLCVPLKTTVECLGLLTVYTIAPRRFRVEEVELLLALAAQSATAIENACLYRKTLETQEQLRQSEHLAALGRMSAGLAHEIRNPLHTMQLLVYAMQQDCPRAGTLVADLDVLQSEIARLSRLAEQFLDFARPRRPKVTPQKLEEIMEETLLVVRAEADRRGIRIDKRWPRDLPIVCVDGAQIKQVFLNILLNAMQAMPSGGVIQVRMHAAAGCMTTEVHDQGEGMLPEAKAQLFTPFFTTKSKGVGLGLSISQRIIEGHRGAIRVASQLGAGATVRIDLPLDAEKADEQDLAGG